MNALLLFLPVLGAAIVHGPVLALDLLPALKRPLDGGRTWRGARLLGDNKTWRGALFMTAGVVVATLGLSRWPWWWFTIPAGGRDAGPLVLGLLLGAGTVLGELPNSFLKRRLGIAPGSQRRTLAGAALSLFDQADFVLAIWALLLPLYVLGPLQALAAFAAVTAGHLAVNLVGYAVGARDAPI